MYNAIKKGSTEEIYGYLCQLPPVGYGVNSATGALEKTDIIKRSNKKEEQFWERTPLPADWAKKRRLEIKNQADDEDYYDPALEAFREQEWKRRLCGVWVYMNGKPVYLPGVYYFYLNWWLIDDGYPKYREPDRKFFYVWKYCEEDSRCAGLIETTKRRAGKTYRGGCIVYEYCSRVMEATGGMQSKTLEDVKKNVFQKAIIHPFKKLPDFFMPVFDQSKSLTPTTELRFIKTAKKGKNAMADIDKPELNSIIDYRSSDEHSYDGYKLHRYFVDEAGKTMEADIYKRHHVTRYCLEVDGHWIGKALYSTTVEDMESGGANFKKLWSDSDANVRDANGRTKSGFYRYFTPAFATLFFDKYGQPDIEQGKQYYLNERAGLADRPTALSSAKRKSPFDEHEMFFIDGERCLYDTEKLNYQLDALSYKENVTTRGNFVWENGVRDSRVMWEPYRDGKWEICWLFDQPEESNNVMRRGALCFPNNTTKFVAGADPFSHDVTVDNRRSDGAGLVLKKFNAMESGSPFNHAFVCKYRARPPAASMYYEDMLKMAVYFGCQILFENNKNNWKDYFVQRGYEAFLMKLRDYPDYGIPGNKNTHMQLAEVTEEYINDEIDKVYFPSLINDWLEFEIDKTTKYDLAMASGYCLIADMKKIYRRTAEGARDVTDYFKVYKAV